MIWFLVQGMVRIRIRVRVRVRVWIRVRVRIRVRDKGLGLGLGIRVRVRVVCRGIMELFPTLISSELLTESYPKGELI